MKNISLGLMVMAMLFLSSQADARHLKKGMRGHDVKQWQVFLKKRGYKPGSLDGIYGRQTMKATINFQKRYKIKADGIVGPKTTHKAMSQGYQHFHDNENVPRDCC